MNLSYLGAPTGPMVQFRGGFANRMYRLDTGQGSFAVKELYLVDRRSTSHVETFLTIARFVDTCETSRPVVLTHRDIQP